MRAEAQDRFRDPSGPGSGGVQAFPIRDPTRVRYHGDRAGTARAATAYHPVRSEVTVFSLPLENAVIRMRRMLFRPFHLELWLVLGFAAFLSGLDRLSWGFLRDNDGGHHVAFGPESVEHGVRGAMAGFFFFGIVGILAILALAFFVTLLWLSSRGKFIYLDNLVQERIAIVEPWRRLGRLGDSLFLWRVVFYLAVLLSGGVLLIPMLLSSAALAAVTESGLVALFAGAVWLTVALAFGIAVAYVSCFVENFIVPIMYRDDVSAFEAWRRFLPLLRSRPGPFLGYGLIVFLLGIGVWIAVFLIGLVTCCVGWVVVLIPYVGTVVLLPVWTAYRAYGPEFLAQFGPQYTVFTTPPAGAGSPPSSPSGPAPGTPPEAPPEPPPETPPGPPPLPSAGP